MPLLFTSERAMAGSQDGKHDLQKKTKKPKHSADTFG